MLHCNRLKHPQIFAQMKPSAHHAHTARHEEEQQLKKKKKKEGSSAYG